MLHFFIEHHNSYVCDFGEFTNMTEYTKEREDVVLLYQTRI